MDTDKHAVIIDCLAERAAECPDHPAFVRRVDGGWQTVSTWEFADRVAALAAGLVAVGIASGDRVAIMSGTSYEWVLCDFAIWTAGAVSVPIYETSPPARVAWLLEDSDATAVFVADERLRAVVAAAGAPAVRHVWRMTEPDLDTLVYHGSAVRTDELGRRRRAMSSEQPASIVYTSGTTGPPRGCVLTHANLLAEVDAVTRADGIAGRVLTDRDVVLLFLPLAHVLTRIVQLAVLRIGALTVHTDDLANLPAWLADVRPTVLLAVPRVFEKVHAAAARAAADQGHRRLFAVAERAAVAYSRALDGVGPGAVEWAWHKVFDRLVYRKVRAALGGRVRYAVSGGAPLADRLAHFFRGAGVTVLEGWGLTETTAAVTLNLPDANRIGTVGRPLPGCEVRIGGDGEVLVRGPTVFAGYWRDDRATQEAVDQDGWFHTGDLGALDEDGYLRITGRQKDIIVTAGGKNVAPAPLEHRVRAHWLVDECVVVGDNRPYVAALITLDATAFTAWKRDHGVPVGTTVAALRADAELRAAVRDAIDAVNQDVSRAEAIRRFTILDADFAVGDELTPTEKVRRAHVLAKFADDVAALYQRPAD